MRQNAAVWLAKPADPDAILAMLSGDGAAALRPQTLAPSVRRIEWEHIQRVLGEHGGNVSETARALGMHRRSLQRKLAKKPVSR